MIKSLKNFFGQTENKIIPENNDLYLLCGLMMETASIDGVIDQSELNKISNTLINIFKEDPLLVEREIKKYIAAYLAKNDSPKKTPNNK